ncbi:tRNA-queuosine alpha-mannosyltransferase domain-containing protein [Chitinivibrio alkaliphilus]|uniref:tRNA-queuosine alpha-mannosyltransferase n=1 Tax=Chitinivibrio alkaliphilus ACht1 TaxID=1313304 RepID=U7D8K1_9BACT|nr:DUF3524 domain-containing protein [Chitinivibrio alkaliphilus]ERP30760.1 glycosyltransferase-like protein [Chitinivibrio alkaliphilus ACht1]
MNIALIEPFFTGSHKTWAQQSQKLSKNPIDIFHLPGIFWKSRMNTGAAILAKQFMDSPKQFDRIIATSMLDLPLFLALTRKKSAHIPCYYYFHENQLAYPWSPKDREKQRGTDMHYILKNYTSALAADKVFFNSVYNRDSLLQGLTSFFRRFPDTYTYDPNELYEKSMVLPIGIHLSRFDQHKETKPEKATLLWNHRWEPDKNPHAFVRLVERLYHHGLDFNVIVAGEQAGHGLSGAFSSLPELLGPRLIHFGYAKSFARYAQLLHQATHLPVTSTQDFFGISIMEAVYCRAIPFLPDRLTYPSLFNKEQNEEYFYKNEDDLFEKISHSILKRNALPHLRRFAAPYDWKHIISQYDQLLK